MTIDLDKLERIRDQVESLNAGASMQFKAYQERSHAAQEMRRHAVSRAPAYSSWTIPEILALDPADAERAHINLEFLRAAKREAQIAAERKAEFDRLCSEKRGIVGLLQRLDQYAGITN